MDDKLKLLIKYQKRYGQKGSESKNNWILKKRTINVAVMIIMNIQGFAFEELESAMYFSCSSRFHKFIRRYESQLEEAYLFPDHFTEGLDAFFRKTCFEIEENGQFRDFFDFCLLLKTQLDKKIKKGYRAIFDAYLSMLMQQTAYFSRNRLEDSVCGIQDEGLMFCSNPYPYIDLASYKMEKLLMNGKTHKSRDGLFEIFRLYGYDVQTIEDVEELEARSRTYDNNCFCLIPYINEQTKDIVPKEVYKHHFPAFPRKWKENEFYREKLSHRMYMLPVSGVHAYFVNAGSIKEIFFQETIHEDEMVLLYRINMEDNGEMSGYYRTKENLFYSIYAHTNRPEFHELTENFILENYMLLTCAYEIDRKRNYAIRQVDMEALKKEFHYPHQPLVAYMYEKRSGRSCGGQKNYVKEEFQEEIRSRTGYIRNLPANYRASEEAVERAASLGLEIPVGKTFVRSHDFRIYKRISEEK